MGILHIELHESKAALINDRHIHRGVCCCMQLGQQLLLSILGTCLQVVMGQEAAQAVGLLGRVGGDCKAFASRSGKAFRITLTCLRVTWHLIGFVLSAGSNLCKQV